MFPFTLFFPPNPSAEGFIYSLGRPARQEPPQAAAALRDAPAGAVRRPICDGAPKERKQNAAHMGGILINPADRSALGELGGTSCGFQAVLFAVCRLKPLKTLTFFTRSTQITSNVTSKMAILCYLTLIQTAISESAVPCRRHDWQVPTHPLRGRAGR